MESGGREQVGRAGGCLGGQVTWGRVKTAVVIYCKRQECTQSRGSWGKRLGINNTAGPGHLNMPFHVTREKIVSIRDLESRGTVEFKSRPVRR